LGANGARQEAMLGAVWPTAPQVDGALATSGTARATARACMAYRAGQWLQARATWHALAPLTHSDRPHRASKCWRPRCLHMIRHRSACTLWHVLMMTASLAGW